ncbi:MAG TPA: aminotransferase class I/II-fold pyridoxal phosphate-dependent enzyme [Candidatus Ruthenibacterium merdigallinarum]|nr:aminotransferase class I/II-fold pyridoxal phosphate-dependent enzyme [Candidatus Ruthenibacterium merdigallinarum]
MINFDLPLDRHNTNTWKWDGEGKGAAYPMGTADMDFRMPDVVRQALHDKIDQGVLSYCCDKGYFQEAFAGYQNRHYGLNIDPAHVFPGTALMAVYKVLLDAYTSPGDGVIIQTPTFGHLYNVPRNNGRLVYENRLVYDREKGEWHINFEQLEEMARDPKTRVLVVCNPGNPVTRGFTKEEMQRMYDLCVANDVLIISDEIHSDVYYDGRQHVSILHVCDKDASNCIMLTSSGKVFGIPGLKAAVTVIPNEKLRRRYEVVSANVRVEIIDLGLVGMAAGLNGADEYIAELQKYLQANKDYAVKFFAENDMKVVLTKPEASYLFWLDFTEWGMTCEQLEKLLYRYGIVYSSGTEFGPGNEGFMRMNIACTHKQLQGMCDALKKCYEENIKK